MEKLDVVACFDWLEKEEKVGTLGHETLRGSDVFSFEFDGDWLKRYADICFGRDLLHFVLHFLTDITRLTVSDYQLIRNRILKVLKK